MKRFLIPALLVVAALSNAETNPQLRIGKIIIETLDVYSHTEADRGFFYRTASRLHTETRGSVIRKFLLLREGDVFNPVRLEETERNLRGQHYLKSASVTALPPRDGIVDVLVVTQDAWSIAPETKASSAGGATDYSASINDTNVLGWGKEAEVSWTKDINRTRYGVHYSDPMLFDGYWSTFLAYGHTSDGYDQRISLRRPFFSFSTPWAVDANFVNFRRQDKIYADGAVAERFEHEMRNALVSWGRALDRSDGVANRIVTGLRFERDQFETINALPSFVAPPSRDYRYLFARFEHAESDFVKLNFINKDLRYEDFNLGRQYSMEGAISPRGAGAAVNSAAGAITFADGVPFGPASFVISSANVRSRFDSGMQNAIATLETLCVKRSGDEHPSTFVARVAFSNAWRQDRDSQFFVDGEHGLRGYRVHSFTGSRAIVINVEQRFYLGRELLQLASPGLVAFADAGNATSGGFGALMRMKLDAGVGIRVGLPRTPKNLLRIDFAYAFNRDPLGRRGFLVSFSSGQAF